MPTTYDPRRRKKGTNRPSAKVDPAVADFLRNQPTMSTYRPATADAQRQQTAGGVAYGQPRQYNAPGTNPRTANYGPATPGRAIPSANPSLGRSAEIAANNVIEFLVPSEQVKGLMGQGELNPWVSGGLLAASMIPVPGLGPAGKVVGKVAGKVVGKGAGEAGEAVASKAAADAVQRGASSRMAPGASAARGVQSGDARALAEAEREAATRGAARRADYQLANLRDRVIADQNLRRLAKMLEANPNAALPQPPRVSVADMQLRPKVDLPPAPGSKLDPNRPMPAAPGEVRGPMTQEEVSSTLDALGFQPGKKPNVNSYGETGREALAPNVNKNMRGNVTTPDGKEVPKVKWTWDGNSTPNHQQFRMWDEEAGKYVPWKEGYKSAKNKWKTAQTKSDINNPKAAPETVDTAVADMTPRQYEQYTRMQQRRQDGLITDMGVGEKAIEMPPGAVKGSVEQARQEAAARVPMAEAEFNDLKSLMETPPPGANPRPAARPNYDRSQGFETARGKRPVRKEGESQEAFDARLKEWSEKRTIANLRKSRASLRKPNKRKGESEAAYQKRLKEWRASQDPKSPNYATTRAGQVARDERARVDQRLAEAQPNRVESSQVGPQARPSAVVDDYDPYGSIRRMMERTPSRTEAPTPAPAPAAAPKPSQPKKPSSSRSRKPKAETPNPAAVEGPKPRAPRKPKAETPAETTKPGTSRKPKAETPTETPKPPAPKKPSAKKPSNKKESEKPTPAKPAAEGTKPTGKPSRPPKGVSAKTGGVTKDGKPAQYGPEEEVLFYGQQYGPNPKPAGAAAPKGKRRVRKYVGRALGGSALVSGTALLGAQSMYMQGKQEEAAAAKAAETARDSRPPSQKPAPQKDYVRDNLGRKISRREFNRREAWRAKHGIERREGEDIQKYRARLEKWKKNHPGLVKAEADRRQKYRRNAGTKRYGKEATRRTRNAGKGFAGMDEDARKALRS
jgi:hypothetical protein